MFSSVSHVEVFHSGQTFVSGFSRYIGYDYVSASALAPTMSLGSQNFVSGLFRSLHRGASLRLGLCLFFRSLHRGVSLRLELCLFFWSLHRGASLHLEHCLQPICGYAFASDYVSSRFVAMPMSLTMSPADLWL